MTPDINTLLQAMNEPTEPENFACQVLNASLNGLYIHDVKLGIHVFINAQYTKLTGYHLNDIQTLDKERFLALIHPDDRRDLAEHIREVVRTGDELLEHEYRFRTRNGRWIWCLSRHSIFARDEDGSVSHIIGSFLDISNRKQAERAMAAKEARYRSLFEGSAIAVWEVDLSAVIERVTQLKSEGIRNLRSFMTDHPEEVRSLAGLVKIVDVSSASLKIFGAASRQDLLTNLARCFTAATWDVFCEKIIILAQGKIHFRIEMPVVRLDGEKRIVSFHCAAGAGFEKSLSRMLVSFTDITDSKRIAKLEHLAQIELAAQLVKTERVNQELSRYVYAVTHDLKAPLRAVRNYADFLFEDMGQRLSGEQKKYLDGLKKAADQGNALIDGLLSFSRIGGVPLTSEAVDVPALVYEICSLLDLTRDIQIKIQPQWPKVFADRTLLKQILQNLIVNGIKFNQSSPKRIEIGWQPCRNEQFEMQVRDNGIGIESRHLDQIFRIFRRLHTNREYEGTGIGLAIVQEAARRLGGTVRVESKAGEGSSFILKFPNSLIVHENRP